MDARSQEIKSTQSLWGNWEGACDDEYAQKTRTEFLRLVKKAKFAPHHEARIAGAANLAQSLYERTADRNDGAKPIVHILRVAIRLLKYGVRDADTVIAALFHDVVEDHPETLARLGKRSSNGPNDRADALAYIGEACNGEVSDIVDHTTHLKTSLPKGASRDEKIAAYLGYVRRVANHPKAFLVKIADVIDNISFPSPEARQRDYSMEKYFGSTQILLEELSTHSEELARLAGGGMSAAMFLLKIRFELMVANRKASLARALIPKSALA